MDDVFLAVPEFSIIRLSIANRWFIQNKMQNHGLKWKLLGIL
jgi:hypothetical protein